MIRIQFSLTKKQADDLNSLQQTCDFATKKELLDNAMTLLEWAVEQRKMGRAILSVGEGNDRELTMPALEHAAGNTTKGVKMETSYPEINCPFCQNKVPEPEFGENGELYLETISKCANCNAAYKCGFHDDLDEICAELARHLKAYDENKETIQQDKIDFQVLRDFDRSLVDENQPVEEGLEICLVFAKKRAQ